MSASYIIPTHNRNMQLAETLRALGALEPHDAEVFVADNASDTPLCLPQRLTNGIGVTALALAENRGAAARNDAARAASGEWLVMLDDDSHPINAGFVRTLADQPADVAAVMADIHLPAQGAREAGGLPEVFIGCGVAIRRGAFLDAGGYDPGFDYYAEEYDLAARFIANGMRVAFEPSFRVDHHKVSTGRDMGRILGRLVRNNGWVIQRYAPGDERGAVLDETVQRYRRIAEKEGAVEGYRHGLSELVRTAGAQERRPLSREHWDRFTGLAAAREAVAVALHERPFRTAAIVERGKNVGVVERALVEAGVRVVPHSRQETAMAPGEHVSMAPDIEAWVVGTMSPGPMLDTGERLHGRRVVLPWTVAQGIMGNACRAA